MCFGKTDNHQMQTIFKSVIIINRLVFKAESAMKFNLFVYTIAAVSKRVPVLANDIKLRKK
jgi:hypothetical protein